MSLFPTQITHEEEEEEETVPRVPIIASPSESSGSEYEPDRPTLHDQPTDQPNKRKATSSPDPKSAERSSSSRRLRRRLSPTVAAAAQPSIAASVPIQRYTCPHCGHDYSTQDFLTRHIEHMKCGEGPILESVARTDAMIPDLAKTMMGEIEFEQFETHHRIGHGFFHRTLKHPIATPTGCRSEELLGEYFGMIQMFDFGEKNRKNQLKGREYLEAETKSKGIWLEREVMLERELDFMGSDWTITK